MMNDNDMIGTVREPFAQVRMATPVEAVVARGRAIRRRRLWGASGAAAVVAAAAVLVTLVALPGGRPAPVRLAAWTVTTQPGGIVAVSIRDLLDPAGLQRALRAHGVPAIVRFHPAGSLMPSCVIPAGSNLATTYRRVFRPPPAGSRSLMYIDPAAIPRAAKIGIDAARGNGFGVELLANDGRCLPPSRPGKIGIGNSLPATSP
jgi:hypothetical protein